MLDINDWGPLVTTRTTLAGIDLNLVRSLDALLSERNVTRAAARLSIGQPAMSAALRRLRHHFGDPLLIRDGRLLTPTPLAESLQPSVRAAVDALAVVFDGRRDFDPRSDARSFRIMASDYVTMVLLRAMILEFADLTPLQRAVIVPVQRDYAEQLANGQIDLLVIPNEVALVHPATASRQLFTDRLVLVAADSNGRVHENMTPEEFADLPYVSYSAGWTESFIEAQLRSGGFLPRIEMSTQSFVIAPLLVEGSALVAVAHRRLAQHLARRGGLKIVELNVPFRPVTEMLYWHSRFTDDPAHSWWRGRVAEISDSLDG